MAMYPSMPGAAPLIARKTGRASSSGNYCLAAAPADYLIAFHRPLFSRTSLAQSIPLNPVGEARWRPDSIGPESKMDLLFSV